MSRRGRWQVHEGCCAHIYSKLPTSVHAQRWGKPSAGHGQKKSKKKGHIVRQDAHAAGLNEHGRAVLELHPQPSNGEGTEQMAVGKYQHVSVPILILHGRGVPLLAYLSNDTICSCCDVVRLPGTRKISIGSSNRNLASLTLRRDSLPATGSMGRTGPSSYAQR